MYKIIGADRKEYGPVSTEVICAWIADGRANGLTLAQAEGSTEWKPLLALPDFEMALAVHDGLRPGHPATMSGGAGFPGPRPDIPTYLVWSILCMVLCCPIPGVPALIYASQVNPKLDAGDLPGAQKASQNARLWCCIAFGIGALLHLASWAFLGKMLKELLPKT